jgi:hypothetical protein
MLWGSPLVQEEKYQEKKQPAIREEEEETTITTHLKLQAIQKFPLNQDWIILSSAQQSSMLAHSMN